jgi:chromosome partitioning protein
MSLTVLRQLLYQTRDKEKTSEEKVARNFGIIILDPPPERSHLTLSSLGAGNCWAIPAEANVKGIQSLIRTVDLIKAYETFLPESRLLGAIPFRARWVGLNPTKTTKESIELMANLVGDSLILPNLLESDIYKRAINEQRLPRDLGSENLEAPITELLQRIIPFLSPELRSIVGSSTESNTQKPNQKVQLGSDL